MTNERNVVSGKRIEPTGVWRLIALVMIAILGTQFAQARSFKVLHAFSGPDGALPTASLSQDKAGNLYGTTSHGGDLDKCRGLGCGVVFKLDNTGSYTVLHTFTGGTDGEFPYSADLARDAAGNFYGATAAGGDLTKCDGLGCGVVFKLDAAGAFSVFYTFRGGTDGVAPGALIIDKAGNLYGTTEAGGDLNNCTGSGGCGVVFMLDPTAKETVLYTFTGGSDGSEPLGSLARDPKGDLYGTTTEGGNLTGCGGVGCGVAFKVAAAGQFSVLHTFTGGPDGATPGGLIRDKAGNLYGTAVSGGSPGYGNVFKLHGHTQTILYSFKGAPDGRAPVGGLVQDKAGNLYGSTGSGGTINNKCSSAGCGTVFKLDPNGVEKVLLRFNI